VSEVPVEAVTVPVPDDSTTELFPGVRSKPAPLMVRVVALKFTIAVSGVTVGCTVATCVELLLTPSVVTITANDPAVGAIPNVTVNWVDEFTTTSPTVPDERVTKLTLPALVSKPVPVITSVGALADRLLVFSVTVGVLAGTTFATLTGLPLVPPSVVTTA